MRKYENTSLPEFHNNVSRSFSLIISKNEPFKKLARTKMGHDLGSDITATGVRRHGKFVTLSDMPQFRWGNPYFFSENLYQSVSFIYASMYRENVHAIHITMRFAKKIVTLCYKNRQHAAAKNQNRSFTSRGATVGLGLRL